MYYTVDNKYVLEARGRFTDAMSCQSELAYSFSNWAFKISLREGVTSPALPEIFHA